MSSLKALTLSIQNPHCQRSAGSGTLEGYSPSWSGRFSKSCSRSFLPSCSKSIYWTSNRSTVIYLGETTHTRPWGEVSCRGDCSVLQPLLMKAIIITQQNQYSQLLLGKGVGEGGGVVLFEVRLEWAMGLCAALPENKIYGKAVFIADWL